MRAPAPSRLPWMGTRPRIHALTRAGNGRTLDEPDDGGNLLGKRASMRGWRWLGGRARARLGRRVAPALLLAASAACGIEGPVEPGTRDTVAVAWRTPVSGRTIGGDFLAADDARLYALVDGLSAYDLATGQRAWQKGLGLTRSATAVVHSAGRVFVASSHAVALDGRTGTELWRFTPDSVVSSPPAVDERALYIGTQTRRVYALDVATGRALWSTETIPPGPYPSSVTRVVASGDSLYVSLVEEMSPTGHIKRGWIVALDRLAGRVLWRWVNERPNEPHDAGGHAVAGRMLLLNDLNGGAFVGLDRFTGQEAWRRVGPGDRFGARDVFSVADGVAYVASLDTRAYALEPETGRVLWQTSPGGSASSSAVCGGSMFAAAGSLHQLRRGDGDETASLFLDEWGYVQADEFVVSRLLAHGGRVYFVGYRHLYAVECG
jgi:outer membrane protein assembly factor BamB